MIIVPIIGPTFRQAIAQVKASTPFADLFEFRLDMIAHPDIARLLSSTSKSTIATCRPFREGGRFKRSEAERLGILLTAASLGATFVDLELSISQHVLEAFLKGKARVILSSHKQAPPRTSVHRLYQQMHRSGADVIKLAYLAGDASEIVHAMEFLRLAKFDRRKAIAIAMGAVGEASRILYKKFGGWATYASSEIGAQAAPGQLKGSLLKELYRADTLNRSTKVFGVVGNPTGQSKGVFLHNPLFKRAGKNAVYCRFLVKNLAAFMTKVAPHLAGFSVTIPYKVQMMKYLDSVGRTARAIGAVNTVMHRKKGMFGTNTDAPGALDAIENVLTVKGKRILIVGAGGAARAIAFEAKRRGGQVVVANRTDQRARDLAHNLGVQSTSFGNLDADPYDIIVNATPVGMVPAIGQSLLPGRKLRGKVVFDAVFNPPMTRLLQDAKRGGARIISGVEMYVNQAMMQSRLYSGVIPDRALVRKLLLKIR